MLGKTILELRKTANLTQKELAEILNISAPAISLWEKDLTDPSIENIKQIAKYFEVTTDFLLGLEDDFGKLTEIEKTNPFNIGDSSEEARLLLTAFERLDKTNRASILRMIKAVCPDQEKEIDQLLKTIS